MIIDSHAHIGTILNFNMTTEMIIESMNKYNIDFMLLSNGEAAEVDHNQNPIPKEDQFGQIELNERLLEFVRDNQDRLGAFIWIKPTTEGCTKELEQLIIENREMVYGIKVHPYHSKLAFNDELMFPYFEMAKKLELPVVTHTANDYESSPKLVYEMAKKYPSIDFVMVHMGLGTDNEEAIELIRKLPNLYGDSTWVKPEKVLKAIQVCGKDKIMFGSDNPIDGVDTYKHEMFYDYYLNKMNEDVSKDIYEHFIFKNALKVFRITK